MGLFGGFKAKFTRDSKSKENKPPTGVIPLNYKLKSEFDSGNSSTQLSNGNKPVVLRIRPRPPIRSATFEDSKKALLEKLKSKSLTNLTNGSPSTPILPIEHETVNTNDKKQRRVSFEDEYNKNNSIYAGEPTTYIKKSNSVKVRNIPLPVEEGNYIYTGVTGSIHQYEKVIPTEEHSDASYDDTPSTLIMMTQHEPEESKLKIEPVLKSSGANQNFASRIYDDCEEFKVNTMQPDTEYDDNQEDFKVNIMQHDRNYVSEDELSYVEDETPSNFNGYSSQATSIFFGETTAPPPIRPRKMNLRKYDEEDEMEC